MTTSGRILFLIAIGLFLFAGSACNDSSNSPASHWDQTNGEADDDSSTPSATSAQAFEDDDDDNDNAHDDDDDDDDDNDVDSDMDGISDQEEIADGTDPDDPSDARAWHPEWTGHPRLLFSAADIIWIRDRCLTGPHPYPYLYGRVQAMAQAAVPEHNTPRFDPDIIKNQGHIAKVAAFAAVVGQDPAMAQKAVDILIHIRTDLVNIDWASDYDQHTIRTSYALLCFCQAYDWLVGFGFLDGEERITARALLEELAWELHRVEFRLFPFVMMLTCNNHATKLAAGLGMVGMLFNDTPQAALYMSIAMTETEKTLLEFQNTEGGGQAEGPHYMVYSAESYFPFMAGYARFAEGADYPYKRNCLCCILAGCDNSVRTIEDFWTSSRLFEIHQWWLDIRTPTGHCPNYDDGRFRCNYAGLLAAQMESAEANDLFLNSSGCSLSPDDSAVVIETIVLHDPDLDAAPAAGSPMRFLPEAGNAVLRTGWDDQALYLHLLGEHGDARRHGWVHEQTDATSFLVFAFGENFLIDSGYGAYGSRMNTACAENHNMILVDGEGPSCGWNGINVDVDAFLSDPIDDGVLQAATVSARYSQVDFTRRALLIDGQYFATFDKVEADGPHDYSFLLHTQAGGDTDGTFTLLDDGCRIERPGAEMTVTLAAASGQTAFRQYEDLHANSSTTELMHAALALDASSADNAFIGVYLPMDAGDRGKTARVVRPESGAAAVAVELDDSIDLLVATDGAKVYTFPEALTGLPEVRTDRAATLIRFDPSSHQQVYLRMFD